MHSTGLPGFKFSTVLNESRGGLAAFDCQNGGEVSSGKKTGRGWGAGLPFSPTFERLEVASPALALGASLSRASEAVAGLGRRLGGGFRPPFLSVTGFCREVGLGNRVEENLREAVGSSQR